MLASLRSLPNMYVSMAMPLPSGSAMVVARTRLKAAWWDSVLSIFSSCFLGMRMAVPPLVVRELRGTANR